MALLPATFAEFTDAAGGVYLIAAPVMLYVGKRLLDAALDVLKVRLLRDRHKGQVLIYAPDGTVVRRVERDLQ